MAFVKEIGCAGLILLRLHKGKPILPPNGSKGDNKGAGANAGPGLLSANRLEIAFLENYRGDFVVPNGEIRPDENEMGAAQRITHRATGLLPSDYDILREFNFILEGNSPEAQKASLWVAVLKDANKHLQKSPDFKNLLWIQVNLAAKGFVQFDQNSQQLLEWIAGEAGDLEKAIQIRRSSPRT